MEFTIHLLGYIAALHILGYTIELVSVKLLNGYFLRRDKMHHNSVIIVWCWGPKLTFFFFKVRRGKTSPLLLLQKLHGLCCICSILYPVWFVALFHSFIAPH